MTKENIKAFFEALSQDEALQKALKEKELAYTGAKDDRETIVETIVIPVAKAAGYDFTLEELKEFEKGMRPEGELNESELESVAGGLTWGVCVLYGFGGGDMCVYTGFSLCVIAGFILGQCLKKSFDILFCHVHSPFQSLLP